jgi:ribosome-associated translation inhibitor RaiA
MTEKAGNFDFEWQNKLGELGELEFKLRNEAEVRLQRLSRGHTDVTGASIILEHIDSAGANPYLYRARIVAYTRPEYIAGVKEADNAQAALKGALDAVERQVREKREKLRERWKQQQKGESI